MEDLRPAAGASTALDRRGTLQCGGLLGQHCGGIIGSGLPLDKADGAGGAGGQAVSQAVTVVVPQQHGFVVHHADGAFMAGVGTGTAAIALVTVNFNYGSNHRSKLL